MGTRETPGFLSKFMYNSISEKLGRRNEYFNSTVFTADIERLKRYHENRGFSDVRIDTSLLFSPSNHRVDISITIREGYRSLIDTLVYRGIVDVPGTVWVDIATSPKISQGDPFNFLLLEEEVKRVLRTLYDNGYANATYVRENSSAKRKLSNRNYSVVLTFAPGKRYRFGGITIRQEIDSLRNGRPRPDITNVLLLDQLDFEPGDYYSLTRKIASEKSLNKLGLFDLRRFDFVVPPSADTSRLVATNIVYRSRDRHELSPELIVSDENGAFNLGGGIGYASRNFLGGARTFTANLRFRTQTLGAFPNYFDNSNNAVSNLDLTFEILQPYVFTNKMRGQWGFSAIIDKQKPYLQQILRNIFGFDVRFAEFTTGYLEWALEAVSLHRNQNFFGNLNDPLVQQQLALLQEQHLNSILSFSIQRDMSNDLFAPSAGFIHSATFEEAGLLPLVLKNLNRNIPFTQFYRVFLLGRWYADITDHRFSILALKLKAGLEEKYGESQADSARTIPQTHRFFAGGGSSVRGWNSRELIASGDPQLGGNLSVEGSLELRTNPLQALRDGLFDKFWIVQFIDFGNAWDQVGDFQIRKLAIAAGIGFRYDTYFGPFRVDCGFRVYNPTEVAGQQWITQRKLIGQTFKEAVFHFGIGHAF
jgi:outer membrane protein assembly factor BamA